MAIHLVLDDFKTGKYKIPDAAGNLNFAEVQAAIDTYERPYLEKLLGVDQAAAYITWVQANFIPANTDYAKIRDAFSADDAGHKPGIRTSLGIKAFLKACVYFEYKKNGLVSAQVGTVKTKAETADKVTTADTMRDAEFKFNDILETAETIQWYCREKPTAFPDFNGQSFKVKCANFL